MVYFIGSKAVSPLIQAVYRFVFGVFYLAIPTVFSLPYAQEMTVYGGAGNIG